MVNEKFNNLDEQKKFRIINAALMEFAEKDYDQASTNQIVKKAGIGKGMLFYYFNSKQDLYYYLIDYCLDKVKEQFLQHIDDEIEDLIDRLKHITRIKLKYLTEYPEVTKFLGAVILGDWSNIPDDLKHKYEELFVIANTKTYGNQKVEMSLFREDIDANKAYKLIEWSIKGYQDELMEKFKGKNLNNVDLTPYWDEFDEYLKILKTSFYKQEGK